MPNALASETSPYLRQHAENPVDWLPWGREALARAREQDKPLLVSIGYSSCHWCHVMERESFEDARTAQLMNENFVCVKVDREERPDVDALYMEAVQAMTGAGGWPLNVFLTPEQVPFYGGTYFPPDPRPGMPAWTQLLSAIAEAWSTALKGLPNYQDFPGVPIKSQTQVGNEQITTTVTAIKEDNLSDEEFAIPKDFQELKMPKMFDGKPPGKPE